LAIVNPGSGHSPGRAERRRSPGRARKLLRCLYVVDEKSYANPKQRMDCKNECAAVLLFQLLDGTLGELEFCRRVICALDREGLRDVDLLV